MSANAQDHGPRPQEIVRAETRARRHRPRRRRRREPGRHRRLGHRQIGAGEMHPRPPRRPTPARSRSTAQEVTGLGGQRARAADAQIRHAVSGRGLVRLAAGLGECRVRPDPGPRHGARARQGLALEKLAAVGLGRRGRRAAPGRAFGRHAEARALARAIAAEPEIIFFDEPTTGLDPIMADVINELIVKCVHDLGATAISITHDMASDAQDRRPRRDDLQGQDHLERRRRRDRPFRQSAMSTSSSTAAPTARSRWRSARCERREPEMARDRRPAMSASNAAPSIRNGPAGATIAAAGTRSPRKRRGVAPKGLGGGKGRTLAFVGLDGAQRGAAAPPHRGMAEFDRVCGGGLVPGSALLVGGDPGIGKSTLLLQVAAALAQGAAARSSTAPISRARNRSTRCGCAPSGSASGRRRCSSPPRPASATSPARSTAPTRRGFVVVDSIQTMYLDTLDSAPGTVGQVRASAQELIRLAKARGFTLMLVGHVTKDGLIAGPRVLEHMVDTVLYFEGERGHQFRILRAVKNRFGPTDEIGVFEMTDAGLAEVPNPSALFLADRAGAGERRRRLRRHRGHAADAGRDPGAGRAAPPTARRGARWWAGTATGCHGAGGARGALRRRARRPRHLSQRRRRPAHRRAGRRSRGRGGAGLGADLRAGAGRRRWCSARSAFPARSAPVGQADARLKEAAKLGFAAALVPPRRGRGKDRTGEARARDHASSRHVERAASARFDGVPRRDAAARERREGGHERARYLSSSA